MAPPPTDPKCIPSSSQDRAEDQEASALHQRVLRQLWQLYEDIVLPLEIKTHFAHFNSAPITCQEFEARPQVLFIGQYSTGKTSMVKWLVGRDSPHFDIRPQPSTDKFIAVVHGEEERLIPGNAATCLPQLPYQGLSVFGTSFLCGFQASVQPAAILRDITFVDTPGVLSGSKQRIGRDYDFAAACAWMAERADMVLLTFDAHKLDISDEFQEVMEVLRPHAEKVRCVLNKADQIDAANLVRVYGALLWNVGKVFRTPEATRVFISSFWDQKYRYEDHRHLFDEDKEAVLKELKELPRTALLRRINSLVARVRSVKAHLSIVSQIHAQMPWMLTTMNAESRLHRWLEGNLERIFEESRVRRDLSTGDMPNLEHFRDRLACLDNVAKLPEIKDHCFAQLNHFLESQIPALLGEVGGVTTSEFSCRPLPDPACQKRGWNIFGFAGSSDERSHKRQRTL